MNVEPTHSGDAISHGSGATGRAPESDEHRQDVALDIDVVEEVQQSPERYQRSAQLTLNQAPGYIQHCLRLIHDRTEPKVAQCRIIAGCVLHGLEAIFNSPQVKRLLELRKRWVLCDHHDTCYESEIFGLFNNFNPSVANPSMSDLEKVNVTLASETAVELDDLAYSLGMPRWKLVTFVMVTALANQPRLPDAYRELLRDVISAFFDRVRVRAETLAWLLERIEASHR